MRVRGAQVKTIRFGFSVKQKSPFDPLYVQYRYPVTTVRKYSCTDNTCYNETKSGPKCNLIPHLARRNEKQTT